MLQEQIKNGIKEAILTKDTVRLETLRGMSAAFINELVAKGKKPDEVLSDEEALVVIARLAKQRKDSIEQFKKGGREDLASQEAAELKVLEAYLPKMLEKSKITQVVKTKQIELGITDATQKGLLMSSVMKDLKGKADGVLVKEIVDSLF
jgi:uncharacterized protein